MQIPEAMLYLLKQLGIACQGDVNSLSGDNHRLNGISNSMSMSHVDVRADSSPDISAKTFDEHEHMRQEIRGGSFIIHLGGAEQPEAARVVDSILLPILNQLLGTDKRILRGAPPGPDQTRRVIPISVPDQHAGDFVAQVIDVANNIKNSDMLRKQLRTGLDLSLQYINELPGAKPHLRLDLGKGAQLRGTDIVVEPPHFTLHVQNMPAGLARTLATLT